MLEWLLLIAAFVSLAAGAALLLRDDAPPTDPARRSATARSDGSRAGPVGRSVPVPAARSAPARAVARARRPPARRSVPARAAAVFRPVPAAEARRRPGGGSTGARPHDEHHHGH